MKHNKCPHCGSTDGYGISSLERRMLFFDFEGNGQGQSDGNVLHENKFAECISCHKRFRY